MNNKNSGKKIVVGIGVTINVKINVYIYVHINVYIKVTNECPPRFFPLSLSSRPQAYVQSLY